MYGAVRKPTMYRCVTGRCSLEVFMMENKTRQAAEQVNTYIITPRVFHMNSAEPEELRHGLLFN